MAVFITVCSTEKVFGLTFTLFQKYLVAGMKERKNPGKAFHSVSI
jgi:hypothetical protein